MEPAPADVAVRETSLNIKAHSENVAMKVSQPVLLTANGDGSVTLRSQGDLFYLKVPAQAFPYLAPGDVAIVTIAIVKVTIENAKAISPIIQ